MDVHIQEAIMHLHTTVFWLCSCVYGIHDNWWRHKAWIQSSASI